MARVGFVVGGLLLMLVAAPFLVFGGGVGAVFGGPEVREGLVAVCCLGIAAGVAGFILFVAGLVMKSKADLELVRAQTDYLRRQAPPPPL